MSTDSVTQPGVAIATVEDMFATAVQPQYDPQDAGAGSEGLDASCITIPRIQLLQPMSKAVVGELEGAKPGLTWLTPHNRPIMLGADNKATTDHKVGVMRLVICRAYSNQRMWKPKDEGGGILCEAANGDHVATDQMGVKGGRWEPQFKKENDPTTEVVGVQLVGGQATDNCKECMRCGASGGLNGWLPKVISWRDSNGINHSVRVPDKFRKPKCDQNLDFLVLVQVPAFGDRPATVEPAFLTFGRTSLAAGKSIASVLKMNPRDPAWARLFTVTTVKRQNDAGTFYVMLATPTGWTPKALAEKAKELFQASMAQAYRPVEDDDPAANEIIDAEASTRPNGEDVDTSEAPAGTEF